jgi:hypothetical protein
MASHERGGEEADLVTEAPRPVCVFLVPLVRDSDRQPHAPILWRLLQDALLRLFGGFTGPETVLYYRNRDTARGHWSPAEGEMPVEDLSRKYVAAVPEERIEDLRALVRRIGNSFDQRAMYLEVAGYAELLTVRPEDGFLEI